MRADPLTSRRRSPSRARRPARSARAGRRPPGARSPGRFRKSGTDSLRESIMKWMRGDTKRQCDQARRPPRAAGRAGRTCAAPPPVAVQNPHFQHFPKVSIWAPLNLSESDRLYRDSERRPVETSWVLLGAHLPLRPHGLDDRVLPHRLRLLEQRLDLTREHASATTISASQFSIQQNIQWNSIA